MDVLTVSSAEEVGRFIRDCLSGPAQALVYSGDVPVISTGKLDTFDMYECRRRGLYVGTWEYLGGTIVVMPGDLSICIVTWGDSSLASKIVEDSAAWFAEKGIVITRDGNDVLADGKKVVSWAKAMTVSGWCQSVVHFSVGTMDLEMVRAICTKPMVKVPGALSEYGISADDIYQNIVKELLENA